MGEVIPISSTRTSTTAALVASSLAAIQIDQFGKDSSSVQLTLSQITVQYLNNSGHVMGPVPESLSCTLFMKQEKAEVCCGIGFISFINEKPV